MNVNGKEIACAWCGKRFRIRGGWGYAYGGLYTCSYRCMRAMQMEDETIMTNEQKEMALTMMGEGMKATEVADKLGVKAQAVYDLRARMKKKEEAAAAGGEGEGGRPSDDRPTDGRPTADRRPTAVTKEKGETKADAGTGCGRCVHGVDPERLKRNVMGSPVTMPGHMTAYEAKTWLDGYLACMNQVIRIIEAAGAGKGDA